MSDTKQEIEDLKTQVTGLKVKLRRIEDFLLCIPNSEEYIHRDDNEEDLIREAKEIIVSYDRISTSLLQRRLAIGYARAAWLVDKLEQLGVVSSGEGSKPREVLISKNKKKKNSKNSS